MMCVCYEPGEGELGGDPEDPGGVNVEQVHGGVQANLRHLHPPTSTRLIPAQGHPVLNRINIYLTHQFCRSGPKLDPY